MSRFLKVCMIALLALVFIVPIASARPPFVFVGGYYGGPAYYGYYGPAYYGPGWGVPYGYYGYGYWGGPPLGSVKIDTKLKDASVYVDGGYAGTVKDLKTFKLRPGSHNIEVRDHDGHSLYQQKLDVVAGKTIKIVPTVP